MNVKKLSLALALLLCLGSAAFAGVTVSSPTNGATVTSPVKFVASATSSSKITGMKIYVDNLSVYSTTAASISTSIAMSQAKHNVVVQAWDSTGAVFKAPLTLTVSGTTPTPRPTPTPSPTPVPPLPAPPSTAVVHSNIDQLTGWESCTVCAGAGGNGPAATFSLVQNQASPSMDGKSAKFSISGTTPYSDALWWKQLGADSTKTNFKYDLYFYLTTPQNAQTLEFDANQGDGVHHFIYGTQCSIRNHKTWDTWDNATLSWKPTAVACAQPTAFVWHHLTWEFKRTATSTIFVGFTYDGVTHYINRTSSAKLQNLKEIDVAIQLDGNSTMQSYSMWVDKMTLTAW
jgi:hypothetical protein